MVARPTVDGRIKLEGTAPDPDSDRLAYSLYLELGPDQPPLLLTSGHRGTNQVFDPAFAPATDEGRLIVEASDGYHTTAARSNAFVIADKAPLVSIVGPMDSGEVVAGQPMHLTGMGYDYTDNVLPDEALTWVSDVDGALKAGRGGATSNHRRAVPAAGRVARRRAVASSCATAGTTGVAAHGLDEN